MPGQGGCRSWLAGAGLALCLSSAPSAFGATDAHYGATDRSGRTQSGHASYYGAEHAGLKTASGKRFSPNRMTAASRTLPLGATARVTNLANGKSVTVTVTDRGPFDRHRIVDVSSRAAERLDMKRKGIARVKVRSLHLPHKPR